MDNLKCNRLTCRKALAEKAVVTTCSHIFCVDCANELFNASRLCPACETSLTEPDDVVVCSLHPSNDYKTSVLSGLNPTIILEICSRAMSFWQYQVHQEASFQHAVYRNVNEKNAQLQKQLDNVIREANGEISLLNNKITELERDLELERRKAAGLQDSLKDRDKEYQKLKAQYDKIKRKALLGPNVVGGENAPVPGGAADAHLGERHVLGDQANKLRPGALFGPGLGGVDVGAVVGDMEAHGIQRTPIVNRTANTGGAHAVQPGSAWRQHPGGAATAGAGAQRHQPQRQPFSANAAISIPMAADHRSLRTRTTTPDSATSVENLLASSARASGRPANNLHAWPAPHARSSGSGGSRPVHRVFGQSSARRSGGFKPSPVLG